MRDNAPKKTIIVCVSTGAGLQKLKVEANLKTIDDAIQLLISKQGG